MSRAMVAVAVIGLLCVGAAVGVAVVTVRVPLALETPEPVDQFPVESVPYRDERTVEIAVAYGPARQVVSPRGGVVTSAECQDGSTLASGAAPFSIDGQPVLVLATRIPLWRDLAPGSAGPDAYALNEELARLGYEVGVDDTFTWATLEAFRRLVSDAGGNPRDVDAAQRGLIAWLPAFSIPTTGCSVAIGNRVGEGAPLAELPSLVLGAGVSPIPSDLAPGDRVVDVDGEVFAVDPAGTLSDGELDRFAATPSFGAARQTSADTTVRAQLLLREAIAAYAIPPRAIVSDGDRLCVIDAGDPKAVEVLASQLGESFVRPVEKQTVMSNVSLTPPRDATCG